MKGEDTYRFVDMYMDGHWRENTAKPCVKMCSELGNVKI